MQWLVNEISCQNWIFALLWSTNAIDQDPFLKLKQNDHDIQAWEISCATCCRNSMQYLKKHLYPYWIHQSNVIKRQLTKKNIGLTIPGNCLSKSGGFHPWNPYEIWRISPVKSVWNPPDFMKSAGFHRMWAFAWWSSIGLSFERPKNRRNQSVHFKFGIDGIAYIISNMHQVQRETAMYCYIYYVNEAKRMLIYAYVL